MPISAVKLSPDDPMVSGTAGNAGLLKAIPYPSPYFDLSQTYFPASIKELFQYCVYFYNTHCIIPAVVNKLASYPITELVFATDDDEVKKKWESLFIDELNLPFEMFQIGIDMGVYGNCFLGIYFPFKRYLECSQCKSVNPFNSVSKMKIKGKKLTVQGQCPSCKKMATFKIRDKYLRNHQKIKIIRYDPMAIDIIADPVSGNTTYLWDIPTSYREGIRLGKDKALFEHAPKIVLDAVREDKKIKLNPRNMFHIKRPSLSGQSSSWGFPLVMHALKSLYYLQVLKMAQEAIAIQHVIPLWVMFPQASNSSALPPAAGINLGKWKTQIEGELAKWRKDRNYIPILNFPIGFEQIGGEGRALLLGPEVQQELQQVIASMAVPQEFVFGGLTWTGSSITLRMLENTFQGMRDGLQRFVRFLVSTLSRYLGYKQIDIYMAELKMADDIQRQQILMNLEATNKVSTTRLLSEMGFDLSEEEDLRKKEFPMKVAGMIRDMVIQARAQGEAGMVSMDYQIRAQKEQMEEQMAMQGGGMVPPDQGGVTPGAGGAAGQVDPNTGLPIDPNTGLPIDPNTGLPMDPSTGMLIDVNSGAAIDPNTGQAFDLQTGQPISQEQVAAQNPAAMSLQPQPGQGMMPPAQGTTPEGGMLGSMMQPQDPMQQMGMNPMQQAAGPQNMTEAKKMEQEQMAQSAVSSGSMPPNFKAIVTHWATALMFTDAATQQQVLSQMQMEMPVMANLVRRRMMELTQIDPSIAVPEPPMVEEVPSGVKATTVKDEERLG